MEAGGSGSPRPLLVFKHASCPPQVLCPLPRHDQAGPPFSCPSHLLSQPASPPSACSFECMCCYWLCVCVFNHYCLSTPLDKCAMRPRLTQVIKSTTQPHPSYPVKVPGDTDTQRFEHQSRTENQRLQIGWRGPLSHQAMDRSCWDH